MSKCDLSRSLYRSSSYCWLIQQHIALVLMPMEAQSYLWVSESILFLSLTSLFCEQVSCDPTQVTK